MKYRGFILIILTLAFALANVQASVDYINHTLKQNYYSGDKISGKLNLKFSDVPLNAVISTNLEGSITLIDLLNKNGFTNGIGYNCTKYNCTSDYIPLNLISSLELYGNTSRTIGFKLAGQNLLVKEFSLDTSSNAAPSCEKQLEFNFFDNSNFSIFNTAYLTESCGLTYTGCFNKNLSDDKYRKPKLTTQGYCIKQLLQPAPAYKIGVNLIRTQNTPNEKLNISFYPSNVSNPFIANCTPQIVSEPNDAQATLECIVPYASRAEREYYICINSDKQVSDWQILAESSNPTCGSYSFVQTNIMTDFDIYVTALKYASPSSTLSSRSFDQNFINSNFSFLANSYIRNRYGSSCVNNECIIPITINGGAQTVSFSNPNLIYTQGYSIIPEQRLYEVQKEESKVNTEIISLDLTPAQFSIPYGDKPSNLIIYSDGEQIVRIPLNVTPGVLFDISPKNVLAGFPVKFTINSKSNITSASWRFEDSTNAINSLEPEYLFTKLGESNVSLEVFSGIQRGIRTFIINVSNANISIDSLIRLNEIKIESIQNYLKYKPDWIQELIKNKINLIKTQEEINRLENLSTYAKNNNESSRVIQSLLSLDLPSTISTNREGKYPMSLLYNHIDIETIKNLSDSELQEDDETIKKAMLNWLNDNYNSEIKIENIISSYSRGNDHLFTSISISLTKINDSSENSYLVINYPLNAIFFKQNYGQTESLGDTYIPINSDNNQIEFVFSNEITVDNLGIYLSPKLENLEYSSVAPELVKKKSQAIIFIYLGLLLVFILIVAFILQFWYKRRYERYLFKNQDDLYNIMTFMYNSRNSGLEYKMIRLKLLEKKWSGEQISYAFDKLNGKVLGIFGIPIFKAVQEKRVTSEIEKRQQQQLKTPQTFIRRQGV